LTRSQTIGFGFRRRIGITVRRISVRTTQFVAALLVAAMLLLVSLRQSGADGAWLDGALGSWNAPGMAIPAAPSESSSGGGMPICEQFVRPPETVEDYQVADRGWLLTSAYQLGWNISIVQGFLRFDAMCRPVAYQQFVFVDGVFAGTLAPQPMVPRTDGALVDSWLGRESVGALYDRYLPTDGLWCPSDHTRIVFAIVRTVTGPVVVPTQAETYPAPSPGR
jgi:hypothetical protein